MKICFFDGEILNIRSISSASEDQLISIIISLLSLVKISKNTSKILNLKRWSKTVTQLSK